MSRKVRRAVVGQNCAAYLSVEHCKVRSVARRGGETALERAPFGGVAVGLVHDDVELPEIGRPELEEGHPEVARAPHRPKGHDHVDHGSSTTIPRCDDELLSGGGLDGGASCGSTSRGSNPVSSTGWTERPAIECAATATLKEARVSTQRVTSSRWRCRRATRAMLVLLTSDIQSSERPPSFVFFAWGFTRGAER